MSQAEALEYSSPQAALGSVDSDRRLLRQLLWLALPVLAEHALHILVGLTDTYLANHIHRYTQPTAQTPLSALHADQAAAAAAVGTITYILWFMGLLTGAISTGSIAIISRARGARHRSLANSICGQSISAAIIAGIAIAAAMYFFATPISHATGLEGQARIYAGSYLQMLAPAIPFLTAMFVGGACLRGAGDTLTPAITMIVVDIVNVVLSWSLTYGALGFPKMGFDGIAAGTMFAYVSGGVIQFIVLMRGRGGIRLHLHRMRPRWVDLMRLFRIGLPSGAEGLLQWSANYAVLFVINHSDASNIAPAAHNSTIRIESLSYMTGYALAMAAATMVGQSLGMKDPRRATRSAYLAFFVGGGLMAMCGFAFIFGGRLLASFFSDDAAIVELTGRCLFVTGFIQIPFGASIIFSGALRGAGDTLKVLAINFTSLLIVRFAGVMIIGQWLKMDLAAIWAVLSADQLVRGCLMYSRFLHGGWKHVKV